MDDLLYNYVSAGNEVIAEWDLIERLVQSFTHVYFLPEMLHDNFSNIYFALTNA